MKSIMNLTAVVVLTAAVIFLPAGRSWAGEGHEKARKLKQAGDILPLEAILKKALAKKPGRALEVELEKERGGYVYEAEILDKAGVVWEMRLDAKTGAVLSIEKED